MQWVELETGKQWHWSTTSIAEKTKVKTACGREAVGTPSPVGPQNVKEICRRCRKVAVGQ